MKRLLIVFTLFWGVLAQASVQYGFTAEQNQWMAEQNRQMAFFESSHPTLFTSANPLSLDLVQNTAVRAFAEYEKAGYLIFNDGTDFASGRAKLAMAKNLPSEMTLVIYTNSTSQAQADEIRDKYHQVIEPHRLKVVHMPRGNHGFWARDGVPIPVLRTAGSDTDAFLTLVDARYYHAFEADQNFADLFQSPLTQHSYFYEGGNFIANSINECLIVNNTATRDIPDSVFVNHYGCQNLVRLPHVKGIGHADESVKFIDDQTVMTDEVRYVEELESHGYQVVMLPRPDRQYETYVNSLIVNGVVYVPIFNEAGDEAALDVYRQQGFEKVIGLNSKTLSNQGLGSLHCITMTYPDVPLSELLYSMGGSLL